MSFAIVPTAARPVVLDRPGFVTPLAQLRRALELRRQRRLDRIVAETVAALDHAGIAEDYRAACRRW